MQDLLLCNFYACTTAVPAIISGQLFLVCMHKLIEVNLVSVNVTTLPALLSTSFMLSSCEYDRCFLICADINHVFSRVSRAPAGNDKASKRKMLCEMFFVLMSWLTYLKFRLSEHSHAYCVKTLHTPIILQNDYRNCFKVMTSILSKW